MTLQHKTLHRFVLLSSVLLAVLMVGCNSKPAPVTEVTTGANPAPATNMVAPKDSFEKGKVIDAVTCNQSAVETYALYLPKSYTDSAHLPVMIFFDPHGDGNLPLNKYKQWADKFACILIGSNSSKNGMDLQSTSDVAHHLILEAQQRFHVSQKQITLAGFSGGAKVAMVAGAGEPAVSRIIYAGAVQPWQQANHSFSLLGFAGVRDMNYSDLVSFHFAPQLATIPHVLIEWGGKHEWPDSMLFQWAFHTSLNDIPANIQSKLDAGKKALLEREQDEKQVLIQAFAGKDINWWRAEVNTLNAQKKTDVMKERLLGFISLACYSLGNRYLQQNDLPDAEKILTIYQLADPGNKDCAAMWQQYNDKKAQQIPR